MLRVGRLIVAFLLTFIFTSVPLASQKRSGPPVGMHIDIFKNFSTWPTKTSGAEVRPFGVWGEAHFEDTSLGSYYDLLFTFYVTNDHDPDYVSSIFHNMNINDSRFVIMNDLCTGVEVFLGGHCTFTVRFTPTQKGMVNALLQIPFTYKLNRQGTIVIGEAIGDVDLYASSFAPPNKKPQCELGSIINVSNQTLMENVPLVGTDFSLVYSSEFSPSYISDRSRLYSKFGFNLEGWTLSEYHQYSFPQKRLYKGNGTVAEMDPYWLPNGDIAIFDDNRSDVYVFDSLGRHKETRTFLTGAIKYQFSYDTNNKLVTVTDPYNNETTINRDSGGRMTQITSPYGQVTTLALNSSGLLQSVTSPLGKIHSFTYKSGSTLLATFTKPGGQVSTFTYNSSGKLTKDLGHGGDFWEFVRDVNNDLKKISKMGAETIYSESVDSSNNIASTVTDGNGMVSTYSQNTNGTSTSTSPLESQTVTKVTDERFNSSIKRTSNVSITRQGVTAQYSFGQSLVWGNGWSGPFSFTSLTETSTINSKTTTETFDNSTKTKTITSAAGATVAIGVDAYEKPISYKIGNDTATSMSYDLRGRLSTVSQGTTQNKVTYTYDTYGRLATAKNALNEITSYGYNTDGRLTSVTLPDTRVIAYTYDSNGNIASITPPSRPAHVFTFNAMELIAEYQPPALTGVSLVNTLYTYDDDRKLLAIDRPDGQWTVYYYDDANHLETIEFPNGEYTDFWFDPDVGQTTWALSYQGIESYREFYGDQITYEEQSRESDNYELARLDYTFDSEHRRIKRQLRGSPSTSTSEINTTYNNDDKPTQVGDLNLTYSYPSGRLSSTSIDKISDARSYDTYGNLSGYAAYYTPTGGTAQALYSYTLTRDATSRITGKTETIQGVTSTYVYSYDTAGRLTTVTKDGNAYSNYVYDGNGNRTSGTMAGTPFTATYDDQDRILTFNSRTYTHNANGEMTGIQWNTTSASSFSYNALGYMTEATTGSGVQVGYTYDAFNNLVAVAENGTTMLRRLYEDPYKIAGEYSNSGTGMKEFVHVTSVNAPDYMIYQGVKYFFVKDHLGSTRLIVKASDGTVAQRMDYTDLGSVVSNTNPGFQPYGFAGGVYDTYNKIVKFGARNYDAETGRWTSKDPILFSGGDTNLYGYVLNDPINYFDHSGLSASEALREIDEFFDRTKERTNDLRNSCITGSASENLKAIRDYFKETGKDAADTFRRATSLL